MEKTAVNVGDPEPEAPADPMREGYVFDGWDRSVDADRNITYTARWKEAETPTQPTEPTEEPTEPAPAKPGTPVKKEAPKTGDSGSYSVWIAVAAAAAGAGIATLVLGHGKRRKVRK